MTKYLPSGGELLKFLIMLVLVFAVASFVGYSAAILDPVGFFKSMFGKKTAPATA